MKIKNRFEILIFETVQEEKGRRARQKEERERRLQEIENKGRCEGYYGSCDCKDEVKWVYSGSMFNWDKDLKPYDDPNRKFYLCRNCEEDCHAYWNDILYDCYGY